MIWLKNPKPGRCPAKGKHVDAVELAQQIAAAKAVGQLTTLQQYLDQFAPVPPLDSWSLPLPLSDTDQDKVDRLCAVLFDPIQRGRALLTSGTLDTDECSALRQGTPAAWQTLRDQAVKEMVEAGPPLPQWSDGVLGILFGRDACLVYGQATSKQPPPPGPTSNYQGRPPNPTPADRAGDPNLQPNRKGGS